MREASGSDCKAGGPHFEPPTAHPHQVRHPPTWRHLLKHRTHGAVTGGVRGPRTHRFHGLNRGLDRLFVTLGGLTSAHMAAPPPDLPRHVRVAAGFNVFSAEAGKREDAIACCLSFLDQASALGRSAEKHAQV